MTIHLDLSNWYGIVKKNIFNVLGVLDVKIFIKFKYL